MAQFRRLTTIVAAVLLAAVALAAALVLARAPAAGALPALTVTPTTTPVFSATLSLTPDRTTLLVGETLTMTADLTVGEGCIYPIFELQLRQTTAETPIFGHLSPPGDFITGPILMPSVWTFQATQPGTATFEGQTLGERNCDGAWIWQYVYGVSAPIIVISPTHKIRLPAVMKEE